jgi:hypothetical protein
VGQSQKLPLQPRPSLLLLEFLTIGCTPLPDETTSATSLRPIGWNVTAAVTFALVAPSLVVAAWQLGPPGGLRDAGEGLASVTMQGNAAAQPTPSDAHVVQALGSGPLLQGLLANRKQRRAAALALGAHDTHAL